jgi:[ribosomal protein S5]-alanine N-acetyltransferase
MSLPPVLDTLETDRLILRHRRVGEAAIYRQLWTERDLRVPPHRRIGPEGRPTVEDIAAQIHAERAEPGPGILAVERKGTVGVIGYCGLIFCGTDRPMSLSWPTSCCVRLTAAVTQLRQAGPWSLG